MEAMEFLDRVFARVPKATPGSFVFEAWSHGGKPTAEGFGMLPASIDAERLITRIMDVDHYVGNVDHVVESRAIPDSRFAAPKEVHFYQKINVPMLAKLHQEMVLVDGGSRDGFRFAYWYMLDPETTRLSTSDAVRAAYNVGAWITNGASVGYALASAPRKEDVGRLKWAALTKGADVAAGKVVKNNIEGMVRWAQRG